MTHALDFRSVSKTFCLRGKSVKALQDVSFIVDEGEVFGFIGPNGAGKSTTIKVMLGVIDDYEGDVSLHGVSARDAAARKGVAYVPEAPALYEQFTPMEILRMGLAMHGIRRADADAWCGQWLERLSVSHVADRRVRFLSKGTVQRVALAHAMAVSPCLLVLDEPLSGLDPVGRKDVVEILADYKRQGGAIFLTSHVLHDVERIADRFALVHKGQLRTVRSPAELVGEEQILQVRTLGDTAVEGMAQDSDVRWTGEVAGEALWSLLNRLQAAGHVLIEVKPALSLERAFMRFIKEDRIDDLTSARKGKYDQ